MHLRLELRIWLGKVINPILKGMGGIYLKCHLSPKISRTGVQSWGQVVSKFKLGHMEYSKTVSGPKIFFGPTPGPAKLARRKIGI